MAFRIAAAALAIAIACGACHGIGSAQTQNVAFPYALDDDGSLPVWLLNGPYTAETPELATDSERDWPDSTLPWTPAVATHDGIIHLSQAFTQDATTAYAGTEFHSTGPFQGLLTFGFLGTIQIWWNGEPVAQHSYSDRIEKDWRQVSVTVLPGRNLCLIRLDRHPDKPWGFTARVTDTTDHPVPSTWVQLPRGINHAEPFGVVPGARPNPLTHNLAYPPRTGGSVPAERGIFLLGNRLSRAMVILDDDDENGLEFDFHDGTHRREYETFIPEYSRLFIETSRGLFQCTNRVIQGIEGARLEQLGSETTPAHILKLRFTPVTLDPKPKRARLDATVTYFLPPGLNAAVIRVELSNTKALPVEGVKLHHSFVTRDNRFEKLIEGDRFTVLRGIGGKRWVALAAVPHLTARDADDNFAFPNGMLDATAERAALARPGVFYSGKPARNAYTLLSSDVGRVEPHHRHVSYFFVTAGPTQADAIATIKRCITVSGPKMLADARQQWDRRQKEWARLELPEKQINDIFVYSRNALAALPERGGYLSAGYYQANPNMLIRDSVLSTTGMTLAGLQPEAKQTLAYLLDHIAIRPDHWEEVGMLLYGLWHYQSMTDDDTLTQKHAQKLAGWASTLADRIGNGNDRPALIHSQAEGYGTRDWLGTGFSIAQNSWAIIGLEKAVELLEDYDAIAIEQRQQWATAAIRCRLAMFKPGPHAFIHDGRLVKRLLPDGSVQTDGRAEPDGEPAPLEPDLESVIPYLWGLMPADAQPAKNTTKYLLSLWDKKNGGVARYNPLSDPDGPTAGPRPLATLTFAQTMLLQNQYSGAMQLIHWAASEGTLGYTWPERIAHTAARDRDARYKKTVTTAPWAGWLLLLLRDCAGLRPQRAGLLLAPHIPEEWAGLTVQNITFRGVHYTLNYNGWGDTIVSIQFNGQPWEGATLPLKDGTVEVQLANDRLPPSER